MVGGRGCGPAGGAPGVTSCDWDRGRSGGSGKTWQSLRMMGCGGFGKREGRQAELEGPGSEHTLVADGSLLSTLATPSTTTC